MTDGASASGAREKLWTPANVVTLVRICCVPVFVVAIISPWPAWFSIWGDFEPFKPWVAAGIFVLLAATDGLDGYLARSRNEVTNFGKFMDPLADKILVAAALLALVELSVLPSWPALIILTREFIVSGIRMVAASQGTVIAASRYGKAKTVSQIVAIVLFIVKDGVFATSPANTPTNPLYLLSWAVMTIALILTIVSMLDYFVKARALLGFTSTKGNEVAEKRMLQAEEGTGEPSAKTEGYARSAETDAKEGAGEHPAKTSPLAQEGAARNEARACRIDAAAKHVIELAREKGLTIGTAESLTGGLICGALTSVPGSSAVVRGGVVSYVNDVKHDVLGVDEAVLDACGAVCETVAVQMAEGALGELGVDIAVAVTGIAGPSGAEPGKPVGTVWVGIAEKREARAVFHRFPGNREEVRTATVLSALSLLESELEKG